MTPVEVTTKYATSVETLSEAWAFVMDHLDSVGPEPSVTIAPYWVINDDDETVTRFEVVVSGMVHAN